MHLYTEPGWTRSGFQCADVEGYFNAIPTKSILPSVQFQSHASLAGSTNRNWGSLRELLS